MEKEHNTEGYQTSSEDYLKTVSAFANSGTGKICFDRFDIQRIIGTENPAAFVGFLENQIQEKISPVPDFTITIDQGNSVVLKIQKGKDTPYCYGNHAYIQHDGFIEEASRLQYKNLILKGLYKTFTELPSDRQDYTFSTFEKIFEDRFGFAPTMPETYTTLELYSKEEGYTNAAAMISNENPFMGIDVVAYRENRDQISWRETLENISVFEQIEKCQELFLRYYQYETIQGMKRVVVQPIPVEAFREVLIHAVLQREWMIDARIKVEFCKEGVWITIPGGLPEDMRQEDYLKDQHLAILRNKTLSLLFLKLNWIDDLGSGVTKLQSLYEKSIVKPAFSFTPNTISVFLPILWTQKDLSDEQRIIWSAIADNQPISSTEIVSKTGMGKTTVRRILLELMKLQVIHCTGKARAARYHLSA